MYLDVLLPLKVLSVGMQKEEHDPVLILRRLRKFNWTMIKLKLLVESSLQGSTRRLTNYTNFLNNVCEDDSGNKTYQNIKLKQFDSSCESLKGKLWAHGHQIIFLRRSVVCRPKRQPSF